VAGAAPDIGDRSRVGLLYQLGERAQHRPVQRLGVQSGAEVLGVLDGDGVVCRPNGSRVG
jgi:hypothetical protein